LVDSNGNAHVDVHVDDPLHKSNVHVDADLSQPADPTNVEDMKMAAPETPAQRAGVKSSAPFLMDGALKYVQFAGADKKTVFIITNKHHLFRSVDSGFTFHAQADKLDSPSGISQMYHSPADANVLFFLGTDLTHWMTRDLGETYQHVKVPEGSKLLEVELHPTMPGWLLAAALAPECNGHMQPTHAPTAEPTAPPSRTPTLAPTTLTPAPTIVPTVDPTPMPTLSPTWQPTRIPTAAPTGAPSRAPTLAPTPVDYGAPALP
jgi:hypothetical protein